jgi:hypothetical protein
MLGMVFTELLEMVESRFSPELADRVLQRAQLAHGGAYTAVGYYPHEEVVRIVGALSAETGLPPDALVHAFGEHLLGRFATAYPEMFAGKPTLYDFLASIDGHIHVEVHKLYPEARLPRFEVLERSATHMRLSYRSPRQMGALAEGLLQGAAAHYREPQTLTASQDDALGPDCIVFELHARS